MHLKDYFLKLSKVERKALADGALVSVGHLRNAMYGAPISPAVVARLEVLTNGSVTRAAHFPETYTKLWPELSQAKR